MNAKTPWCGEVNSREEDFLTQRLKEAKSQRRNGNFFASLRALCLSVLPLFQASG
jgi:hypothetical protein